MDKHSQNYVKKFYFEIIKSRNPIKFLKFQNSRFSLIQPIFLENLLCDYTVVARSPSLHSREGETISKNTCHWVVTSATKEENKAG